MPRPYHRFTVGEFECLVFQTAATFFAVAEAFGDVPPDQVQAVAQAKGRDANDYPYLINLLYVKTPEHQFLVDAGTGKSELDPEADDLKNDLRQFGIEPAAIDYVILTHAHWDHFAGLHDSAGDLTFPNAHYFMSKTEWGHCTADKQLESADENDPNPANIKKILLSLHESIYFVEGECEILPGVYTIPAPGHTIGQIAVLMTSKGEGLIHAADVTHHTFQIDHPDWSLAYDPLQQESRETRHKLVERAARENLLWMGYHFTFPPVGRVSKDINGYHWHPLAA